MTKKEEKLLKAAKKLEKVTRKYMEELAKVDKIIQKLPVQTTRCYDLEKEYFAHVPKVASACVHLELLRSKLESQITVEEMLPEDEDLFESGEL